MTGSAFAVRPIDDPIDDYISIAGESLLAFDTDPWLLYVSRIGRDNVRGVYDGPQLVGGMAFYRMGQWFGGRELPCAGLSGVAISPSYRGTGACACMLRSVLEELHLEGVPIASLYATTQYLYRTVGFEQAGTQTQYSIPIESIRCSDRRLAAHRYISPPIDKLDLVADARAAVSNGNLGRTEGLWQRLLAPYDGRGTITYLFGDLDAPEGYAILRPGRRDGGEPQPLISTDVAANTPQALRRLLTLLRDHRALCDSFEWFGPPNDGLHFLANEQSVAVKHFMRWMLRIVDLPRALEGRGYDDNVAGVLHLEIRDDTLSANAGRWIVRVADGKARVESGGDGHLSMDIRFLAPLFSSFYSADDLLRAGVIETRNMDQLRLATRLFAGPAPWVPEMY